MRPLLPLLLLEMKDFLEMQARSCHLEMTARLEKVNAVIKDVHLLSWLNGLFWFA